MMVRFMPRMATLVAAALSAVVVQPGVAASPSPAPGTWFDGLVAGACVDADPDGSFDFTVPPRVVPCDGLHAYEIADRVPLGGGTFPSEDTAGQLIADTCTPVYEAFLGRPLDAIGLYTSQVWPDEAEWAQGVHDVVCLVGGSEPLVGSARSGNLVAPGEALAVYYQPADVSELWLADAGAGQLTRPLAGNLTDLLLGPPAWAPDGSGLTVTRAVSDGDVDSWLVPLGDSAPTVLATGPGKQDGANLSPDGRTLAYISNDGLPEYDIFSRPLAGGTATQLTDHAGRDASPQWSPDGSQLLFRRATDGVSDIWLMSADGTEQVRLTDNGGSNYDPRWSPDGDHVLFTSDLGGDTDIWMMNADGTEQRLLTDHPANDEYPTWNIDGSLIAFQSSRYGGPTIWLMRADGSDASLLIGAQPVGYPMFAPVPVQ